MEMVLVTSATVQEMKATEWAACEAFVKPGRHLQPVEDVDAQLNIGLDSDEEGTGAKKKEFDAKKDKGLVGRPGRLDNIFNAAVVSGPPAFRPHLHQRGHITEGKAGDIHMASKETGITQ